MRRTGSVVAAIWLLLAVCRSSICAGFQSEPEVSSPANEAAVRLISEDIPGELLSAAAAVRCAAVLEDACLNDVAAVGRYCWAVGDRGVVCDSEDGGVTWRTRALPFDCRLTSVCFLTNRRGWIAGIQSGSDASGHGVLLMTRDGGESWESVSGAARSLPGILQVRFFGGEEAIVVTLPSSAEQGATLFRTVDGGDVWEPQTANQAGSLWLAAGFSGVDEGILGGFRQGLGVLTTSEAVVLQQSARGLRSLRAVSCGGDQSGWVAGDGGTILRTEDAGITWAAPEGELPEDSADLFDIRAICHQGAVVVAAGDPGQKLLYSENGGRSWQFSELPAAGRICRIRRLGSAGFLAVGSFGQILMSADGRAWECVRGAGRHAAILSVGSGTLAGQSWLLLAGLAADGGLRSVVWQPAILEGRETAERLVQEQEWLGPATTAAVGSGDYCADWQFSVNDRFSDLTAERLLEIWDRQTDGRAEDLLTLRLARQIRCYRPVIIVIESAGEDDCVGEVLRRLIPRAVEMSADAAEPRLAAIGMEPWRVQRVIQRRPIGRVSSVVFSAADLLRNEGTTGGLLQQAALSIRPAVKFGSGLSESVGDEAAYEVILDANGEGSVKSVFAGLGEFLTPAVRRQRTSLDRDRLQRAATAVRRWRLESGVLAGAASAENSAESFVAGLEQAGVELPESLAKLQLTAAAAAGLTRGNLEGWLAIQQELIRRFPGTPEAFAAAELLVLAYGSAELQLLRRSERSAENAAAGGVPEGGAEAGGLQVRPVVQPAAASGFGGQRTAQADALRELWDANERTAWRLLTQRADGVVGRESSPAAVLRHAVTLRRQEQFGAATSLLAGLSGRSDVWGTWARSEQLLTQGGKSDQFRQMVLTASKSMPVLDGKLAEPIWEAAEEVRLVSDDAGEQAEDSLVLLAWDEQYLYLTARIPRAAGGSRVELAENRYYDEPHADRDRLEIQLDTDRDLSTAFRLCVDESGRTSESCWALSSWNPRWHVAVDQEDSVWRVELAIPARELAAGGIRPGALWAIDVRRLLPGRVDQRPEAMVSDSQTRTLLVRFARDR